MMPVTDPSSPKGQALRATYWSVFGNLCLAIAKGVTGYVGNSYALIADAIESSTDVFASLLVLFGLHYATKPPDKNHPYGHGRLEPLITFAVVGFLVFSASLIAYESIRHIRTPHPLPEKYTLAVLAVIVVIKEAFYRIVAKVGKETQSTSLTADAWHHRSDAITSLMAFLGIATALYMGEGFQAADDWAALMASVFIIYNAVLIFRPALSEIMDENNYPFFVEQIREVAANTPGVLGTEKCFVRKMGMSFQVDLHMIVAGDISVREGHDIAHLLKDRLQARWPEITDVHIHVEPEEELTRLGK